MLGCCLALWLPPVHAADDFLEPEQAFRLSVELVDAHTLALRFEIAPGYYLYRERLSFQAEGATLGTPLLPAGKVKFDETFQKEVETYRGTLLAQVPVTQAGTRFTVVVGSQGCADAGLCYPPMSSRFQVDPQNSPATVTPLAATDAAVASAGSQGRAEAAPQPSAAEGDTGTIERTLRSGSWWTVVGVFALMGLLLSFTPCVLPMLPILSSIIAGGGEVSRWRGLSLAVAYSLGMALVYTALGVAAGLAGEGLAAALQKPWVLAAFGLLLAGLALAMFDVYELRLPSGLSTRLDGWSRRLPGGRLVGVFLMGGLSALIVSPCVSAPLAGALVFLSQTRDVALAATALFSLALGMSVPLLLLGASAGAWVPRSGAWMHAVKHFFGLLLLAVALWIVQPVLPAALQLVAWGGLLLVTGFMLRPFDPHPHSAAPRVWLQRAVGLALLAYGLLQLVGMASGGSDPLKPLSHWGSANAQTRPATALAFRPIRSVAELDAALRNPGRPVMLDFYADWCVSCKEMERFTFSAPAVQARLAGALLLKADVTANTDDDKALLRRFALFGPPGTLFFDAQGRELTDLKLVGFQSAESFEKTLQKAGL